MVYVCFVPLFITIPMKLLICNGRELNVYDVGQDPIYTLMAENVPLKPCGWELLEDDDARERLRELRDSGLYVKKT